MSKRIEAKDFQVQDTKFDSPWTLTQRLRIVAWEFSWAVLCRWTPKPLYPWRNFVLRCFGAELYGRPFVHQRARIQIPWNITIYDRAAIGDGAVLYSLGPIVIQAEAVIAQEAYLCTGTHDFSSPSLPLIVFPIEIGERAFIGARAFIMPGVTIGQDSIVGAMSVVTHDVGEQEIWAGNPARKLKNRL